MQIGDAVEIIKADRQHECARIGQRARIVGRQGTLWQLHLKCGHLWSMPEAALRLLSSEEAEPPAPPPETAQERYEREQREAKEEAEARREAELAAFNDG